MYEMLVSSLSSGSSLSSFPCMVPEGAVSAAVAESWLVGVDEPIAGFGCGVLLSISSYRGEE